MNMRSLMDAVQEITEVEIGGGVDRDFIDDIEGRADFTNPQQDLFPEIPTLDPHLPKATKMKIVGSIGPYRVVKTGSLISAEQAAENRRYNEDTGIDYVLFDRNKVVGWVGLIMPPKRRWQIYELDGTAGQVGSIYLDKPYRGQNLGIKFYQWLLTHVCDYLVSDELQTMGGVKLWRRALNSRAFDVLVYDKRTGMSRKRWAGKDFNQVYNTDDTLIPWMTLRGRADELMSGNQ